MKSPRTGASETPRAPDYDGPFRVWRVALDAPEKRATRDSEACLVGYLVDAPGAHAAWRCWSLSLVHLRPVPGETRPALKHFEGATHAVISQALDPDVAPDTDDVRSWRFLTPIDFEVQFVASDDRTAQRAFDACVRAVATGKMSPDADYGRTWGEVLQQTATCIANGGHPES